MRESVNEVGASEEFNLCSVSPLRPKLMVTLDHVEAEPKAHFGPAERLEQPFRETATVPRVHVSRGSKRVGADFE
jgi:hypothetical protein